MIAPNRVATLNVDDRPGHRPESAEGTAGKGLVAFPGIPIVSEPATPPRHCPDENCRHEWRLLPTAVALPGLQPTPYKCRGCNRWWWLIYRVALGRGVDWTLVRIVPSLGRHPDRVRESLRKVPELDEHTIELTVHMLSIQPQQRAS